MFLGSFAVFRSSFAVFSITPFTAPWRQPASVVYRLPVPVLLRLLSLHHYTVTCRHELQIIQKSNGLFIVPRPTTYKNFKPNSTILSIPYHTNFWVILVTDRQTDRQTNDNTSDAKHCNYTVVLMHSAHIQINSNFLHIIRLTVTQPITLWVHMDTQIHTMIKNNGHNPYCWWFIAQLS